MLLSRGGEEGAAVKTNKVCEKKDWASDCSGFNPGLMYRVVNNSKLARIYLYFETLPSGIGEFVARCDGQGSEILKGERQLGAAALSPSALCSSSRNAYLLVLVYSTCLTTCVRVVAEWKGSMKRRHAKRNSCNNSPSESHEINHFNPSQYIPPQLLHSRRRDRVP
jgi:hypothetical protein